MHKVFRLSIQMLNILFFLTHIFCVLLMKKTITENLSKKLFSRFISLNMPTATNGSHMESPGKKQIDVDHNNDDDRRELDRPADVVEDMRQMGQRQRVKTILNSKEFRDELEEIITDALKHGPHPASLIALQQISELLLPHTSRWTTVSSLSRAGGSVIVPINDIRGVDSQGYSKSERLLRCKLASLYRLIDLFGWSQGIYNHITVRVCVCALF